MKASTVKNEVKQNWTRPEAASIQQDASIEDALLRMNQLRVHHLIVKSGMEYRGVLDARDCAGVWDRNQKVQNVMSTDVPVVDESTDIRSVVEIMVKRNLTAVPLKRLQNVSGIITITDLVRLLEAHLTHHYSVSGWLERGNEFLTRPIVQSLSSLLGGAGI